MYEREWRAIGAQSARTCADPIADFRCEEQERVLGVPELHNRLRPNGGSDAVKRFVSVSVEHGEPIGRPPFIDVVFAPLTGDRSAEQDRRAKAHEPSYERCRACLGEMLTDLEGDHEIEATVEREASRQVSGHEELSGDLELSRIDVAPVNSDHIRNPSFNEGRQPGPHTAPNIDHRAGAHDAHHEGNDRCSGGPRPAYLPFEEAFAVGMDRVIPTPRAHRCNLALIRDRTD